MICVILALTLFPAVFTGSGESAADIPDIISFRDVPGVTEEEIRAIEELRNRIDVFVYGMPFSTEAFLNENGEVEGFTALLCEWLTEFFEIPFRPELHRWLDLLDGLRTGEISFSGELTASEERMKIYHMTSAIASRPLKYFRIEGRRPLAEIAGERPVICGFIEGTTTVNTVSSNLEPGTFEVVLLSDVNHVYEALRSGEIDAFFYSGAVEANFAEYVDMVAFDFYPLVFVPVSLSTQDPALVPIISVMEKFLKSGGIRYLTMLYNLGEQEYRKHKLYMQLTDEERDYIKNNPVLPIGIDPGNYPGCFYDRREREWRGVFLDVLDEVTLLTGLSFERVNDEYARWPEILHMLIEGNVVLTPELTQLREREGLFLWPDTEVMIDYYALLSKSEHRNIKVNEVLYAKVGLAKDTALADIFRTWFPDHMNSVEYESLEEAFYALQRGEVDMVMASLSRLLYFTHYLELPNYKANVVFDEAIYQKFGINKGEPILCSIIDKAIRIVDTKSIADQWMRRTYDYRINVVEAQRPWLIGASILLLCVLALIFVMFMIKRREGRWLEEQVKERTGELQILQMDLEIALEAAQAASHSKSAFLANMSHELRTPLNVIIGLTDLMLEETDLSFFVRTNLTSVGNAGGTLLSIVNDILDISKIESGKLTLIPVAYHVPSLLNDNIVMLKTCVGKKPIDFKLKIGEDLPAILYGDELRVRQIINNLLSNAVKYTDEGTVELSVECELDDHSVWMDISVKDTGKGIREEDFDKLFLDYHQVDAKANRKTEGTGLGLSIARRLARMMDGDITATSVYGKGSTFCARLRQGLVSDDKIGSAVAENLRNFSFSDDIRLETLSKLSRADLRGARVLVVDDMQSNLDVAAGLLGKYNIQVDCLKSGRAALDRISGEKTRYDAIFMDHMMPGMDGIETANAIRALETEYARDVPIIALTANAITGTEKLFFDNGFQDFLSKPIDLMRLDAVLKKWIRGRTKAEDERGSEPEEEDIFIDIPGVDAKKGLALYGGDMEIFLSVLRSYGTHTPSVLDKLRAAAMETLPDCAINAHGLKGSSANICAEQVKELAAGIESSARKGDFDEFSALLEPCLKEAEQLIGDINVWFEAYNARREKPRKEAPDREILMRLRRCCKSYDMSGIDGAMEELESFSYDTGADLVAWLREKTDIMELEEVVSRLSEIRDNGGLE